MNNINDGKIHNVLFSKGKLFLDDVQIAGEGLLPEKEITFQFKTNLIETPAPEFLEVNVFDKVAGKSVGPGQR